MSGDPTIDTAYGELGSLPSTDPNYRWAGDRPVKRNAAQAEADRRAMTREEKNAVRRRMGMKPLSA